MQRDMKVEEGAVKDGTGHTPGIGSLKLQIRGIRTGCLQGFALENDACFYVVHSTPVQLYLCMHRLRNSSCLTWLSQFSSIIQTTSRTDQSTSLPKLQLHMILYYSKGRNFPWYMLANWLHVYSQDIKFSMTSCTSQSI